MVTEEFKPLVIQDERGSVMGLKAMNPKAYQKSRENKFLWVYLPENGRVLPFREDLGAGSLLSLEETEYGYLAQVRYPLESGGAEGDDPEMTDKVRPGHLDTGAPGAGGEGTLSALASVIASRHRDLPEGSYTTHLFKSGPDKIRKKLGEEAVELILARERGEVVYETADLFYHTLVLLEALDIPLSEVLDELDRRS